jgi:hypothetical protein
LQKTIAFSRLFANFVSLKKKLRLPIWPNSNLAISTSCLLGKIFQRKRVSHGLDRFWTYNVFLYLKKW